ncbi:OmpA family protein [bacterium]|nr:OmpA family protein [bacterium]
MHTKYMRGKRKVMMTFRNDSRYHRLRRLTRIVFLMLFFSGIVACSNPQPGPDKTVAGAVLGAGWGAGAGAVIGNQIATQGEGVAVGAGFGLVQGGLEGAGYDLNENVLLDQEEELDALRVANNVNSRRLSEIQAKLGGKHRAGGFSGVYQVFFDIDASQLRPGAVANLEVLADQIRGSTQAGTVHVVGHSDDSGDPKYNNRLAEARARNVSAYLSARGVSTDQIKTSSYGSKRPIASNETKPGRQLNRRVDVYLSEGKLR